MKTLLITEYGTQTSVVSRRYVLLLADGETADDYYDEIDEIEWEDGDKVYQVEIDRRESANATHADLEEYEIVGANLDAINAELEEIAEEEMAVCV